MGKVCRNGTAVGTSSLKPTGDRHVQATKGSLKALKETKAEDVDIGTGCFMCGFAGDPQPSYILSSTAEKSVQETVSNQYDIFVGRELQNSSITLTLIYQ